MIEAAAFAAASPSGLSCGVKASVIARVTSSLQAASAGAWRTIGLAWRPGAPREEAYRALVQAACAAKT